MCIVYVCVCLCMLCVCLCVFVATYLFVAIANAPLSFIEFLLQSGAPANFADKTGRTALHYAALHDRPFIAWLLIRRGTHTANRRPTRWHTRTHTQTHAHS